MSDVAVPSSIPSSIPSLRPWNYLKIWAQEILLNCNSFNNYGIMQWKCVYIKYIAYLQMLG